MSAFESLEAVILDEHFPDVDLALRRGRHVGRDDGSAYTYLVDAAMYLEPFYRRFGCELVHPSDGFFYLLSAGDGFGRRQLTVAEMLVGQTLALTYLDPATVQHGGVVTRDSIAERLTGLVGKEALVRALNPRRKKYDERVAAETARGQIAEALRRLADLGFVDVLDDARVRLRSALLRFADPVRTLGDPARELEKLIGAGKAGPLVNEGDEGA